MKALVTYTGLCICLLCPWSLTAGPPACGFAAAGKANPGSSGKNPQIAIVVTEKLGTEGEPLSFFGWYQVNAKTKGKVTHQVSIYRGDERIWSKQRTTKLEEGDFTRDSWNTFCDAYSKGLKPGDIVVFEFAPQGHSIKEGGADLRVQLGPKEMWSLSVSPWDARLFDCP